MCEYKFILCYCQCVSNRAIYSTLYIIQWVRCTMYIVHCIVYDVLCKRAVILQFRCKYHIPVKAQYIHCTTIYLHYILNRLFYSTPYAVYEAFLNEYNVHRTSYVYCVQQIYCIQYAADAGRVRCMQRAQTVIIIQLGGH